MRRNVIAVFVLVFLCSAMAWGQPQNADGCYVGPGLAATLLFPYFEVNLADPLGVGTLLSINNGGGGKELVRVVLWTDWGFQTLGFDIYLKPFDVETINVTGVSHHCVCTSSTGGACNAYVRPFPNETCSHRCLSCLPGCGSTCVVVFD